MRTRLCTEWVEGCGDVYGSEMGKQAILRQRGRGQRSEVAKAHDDRAFPSCAAGHLCLVAEDAAYVRHQFRLRAAS